MIRSAARFDVALMLAACVSLAGCGRFGTYAGGDAWNGAALPIVADFQGEWKFDRDRTFDAWRAAGVPEEQIAQTREVYDKIPARIRTEGKLDQLRAVGVDPDELGKMHADINVLNHVITGQGQSGAEYKLYALHQHGTTVCGKAWHHEDRFDRGDMSKCHVQLALVDGCLHFKMRMQDGLPDLDDPDMREPLVLIAPPSAACEAESPGKGWDDWTIFVFVRPDKP